MSPSFFKKHRLQSRIVAVFLGLLLIIQVVSFVFIQDGVNENVNRSVHAELKQKESIFIRLLQHQAEELTEIAQAVRANPMWNDQITGTQTNMRAQLLDHLRELPLARIMVLDQQGQMHDTGTTNPTAYAMAMQSLIEQNKQHPLDPTMVLLIDGQPVQMRTLALNDTQQTWVAVSTPVDQRVLADMHLLSGLDTVLMHRNTQGDWSVVGANQAASQWPSIAQAWESGNGVVNSHYAQLTVGKADYSMHTFALPSSQDREAITALLLSPMDRALAPFEPLKYKLLLLSAFGLVVFGIGGFLTAKRITSPLRMLTGLARRLEKGDFGAQVRLTSNDEVGELAQSFESMRLAIQLREGEIRRLAYHDALTDLPNREQFRHDIRKAITKADKDNSACAVLLLDIDRFKHINDVLGHRFGDRLLRALAIRLRQEVLLSEDILARLSGDEFGILLHAQDSNAARGVAERVQKALERPITLDDHTVDLGAGIGIAACPANGLDADVLLSRAEVAMYVAKARKSGTECYHPGLDASSEESLTLLSELRYAVDHHQLRLYLQPKVDAATGRVIGGEALVRWLHPERGLVPPMRFIPFAEQVGFIRVLTNWMLEEASKMARDLAAAGMPMKLSVNLSTRDLMDQDLPARIQKLVSKYNIKPALLCLEITESAIMDDPQRAMQTLERLSEMGFLLSIDDFGTGYSSLAYLKKLPVNELKIDQSFVMSMERDLQDTKIVRSTIELAHNLGLSVVAEGVESAKCWKLLKELDCDELQGYFIAKPMPGEEFVAWVNNWEAPDTSEQSLSTAFAALL